jgi:hypothetical protein
MRRRLGSLFEKVFVMAITRSPHHHISGLPGCGGIRGAKRTQGVKLATLWSVAPLVVGLLVVLEACGGSAGSGVPVSGAGSPITTSSPEKTSAAAPATATVTTTVSTSSVAPVTTAVSTVGSALTGPTRVLYRADWSAGLGGWSGSSDWSVLRGELLSAGNGGLVVAPLEVDSTGDFAVEAEIQLLRYQITNGSFGVMVRIQDNGTGYATGHDESAGVIVLRTELGGGRPTLDSQPFTPGDGWHRYRIEVRGNALRVFIDGAPVLSATDNTFLTGKRVGLWNSGAQLSVRSFEVSGL